MTATIEVPLTENPFQSFPPSTTVTNPGGQLSTGQPNQPTITVSGVPHTGSSGTVGTSSEVNNSLLGGTLKPTGDGSYQFECPTVTNTVPTEQPPTSDSSDLVCECPSQPEPQCPVQTLPECPSPTETECPECNCPVHDCPKQECPEQGCPKQECPKQECPKQECPEQECSCRDDNTDSSKAESSISEGSKKQNEVVGGDRPQKESTGQNSGSVQNPVKAPHNSVSPSWSSSSSSTHFGSRYCH